MSKPHSAALRFSATKTPLLHAQIPEPTIALWNWLSPVNEARKMVYPRWRRGSIIRAMQATQKRLQTDETKIKLLREIQLGATQTIDKHFRSRVQHLTQYGRAESVYALILAAYSALSQYSAMEQAEINFDILLNIARGDIHTTCTVPMYAKRSNIHSLDLDRMASIQDAAALIIRRHFTGPIIGCTEAAAGYALILLAYRLLCADLPSDQAEATFRKLAPFARQFVRAARARKPTLH